MSRCAETQDAYMLNRSVHDPSFLIASLSNMASLSQKKTKAAKIDSIPSWCDLTGVFSASFLYKCQQVLQGPDTAPLRAAEGFTFSTPIYYIMH